MGKGNKSNIENSTVCTDHICEDRTHWLRLQI